MNTPTVNVAETVNTTIKNSTICLVSYISTEGYPTTKALLMPRKMEPQGVYWFSTVNHSTKVDGYRKKFQSQCLLYGPGEIHWSQLKWNYGSY